MAILFHGGFVSCGGKSVCGHVSWGTGGGPRQMIGTGSTSCAKTLVLSPAVVGAWGSAGVGVGGVGMGTAGMGVVGWVGRAAGAVVLLTFFRCGSLGFESLSIDLSWLLSIVKMVLKDVARVVCIWLKRARMDG